MTCVTIRSTTLTEAMAPPHIESSKIKGNLLKQTDIIGFTSELKSFK